MIVSKVKKILLLSLDFKFFRRNSRGDFVGEGVTDVTDQLGNVFSIEVCI